MAEIPSPGEPGGRAEIIIRPAVVLPLPRLGELAGYRGLIASMVRREVRLRYVDLWLGLFWAVARPLLMVSVFVFLRDFSGARLGIEIPYAPYLFSGLVLWFYFIEATSRAAASIQSSAPLLGKVYYPRLIAPLTPVLSGLAELGIGLAALIGFMAWFAIGPDWKLLLLPLVVLQCMALALGTGCLFAALRLHRRDWERLLGLILYIGLFISPVIYSPAIIPARALAAFHANPMSGTLLAFRSALFADMTFPTGPFAYSCAFTLVMLVFGIYCFQRTERIQMDRL
jgi:lipopolysaccharide transport system permease protein